MIYRVYAKGTISGFNRRVGGLVGEKTSFGTTIESVADINANLNEKSKLDGDSGRLESGFFVGGLYGAILYRDYIYDSYAVGSITTENKVDVNGVTPKDYFIGGVLGTGHKHLFQNGFSFVNINLDHGEKCGGFSGFQASTRKLKTFSLQATENGSEQVENADGEQEGRDIPVSFIGRGGSYDTGNSNVVVRDFGDGGLCDDIDDDGNRLT